VGNYYFGSGYRQDIKINLSKLGIVEGDKISLEGIGTNKYKNIEVSLKNSDLFERIGQSIWLKTSVLSTYNLSGYKITTSKNHEPIPVRQYLIKHCAPPFTHNDEDLGWKDSPIKDYTGWNDEKALDYSTIYVSKSNACNSNIHVAAVNSSAESYNVEKGKFKKGSIYTNSTAVKKAINDITDRSLGNGSVETKQLFTLVKGRVDCNKSGLTIPIPKIIPDGYDTT
jgi:hypothetical protein